MSQTQLQYMFYDYTADRTKPSLPPPPTDDEIRVALARNNSVCPLNRIIVGPHNEGNLNVLRMFAFTAYKRPNRSCRGCNFGIFAQSGQGKTYVVKQWAATIGIPFVFVQSKALKDTHTLFQMIVEEFKQHTYRGQRWPEIVEWENDGCDFTIPPCIVFFDEAHALPTSMMTALLNAMENSDGVMLVNTPGNKGEIFRVNCRHVCWVAATTERGVLFDAFANRLGTSIEWRSATTDEVTQILKLSMDERHKAGDLPFTLPVEACEIVSRYRRVPREAIDFAIKMVYQKDMIPTLTWSESAAMVAHAIGLDQWGFTHKQVAILRALGQRPIAEGRLATVAKCRIEQVQKYELPMLMEYGTSGPLVVSLSGRGMTITDRGLKELDKRGISHKGHKITAEYFESKR